MKVEKPNESVANNTQDPKGTLGNDSGSNHAELLAMLNDSEIPMELYPAQDFKDGKLWHSFKNSWGEFVETRKMVLMR